MSTDGFSSESTWSAAPEQAGFGVVLLEAAGRLLALPIEFVVRILPYAELTPTAHAAAAALGHLDVGGEVLSVYDAGTLLGDEACTPRLSSMLVVLRAAERRWIVLVDGVRDVGPVELVDGADGSRLVRTKSGELLPLMPIEALSITGQRPA